MSHRHRRGLGAVAAACALTATTTSGVASAQQYLPAISAQAASGLEGGGRGFQRARTRVRLSLELRIDEAPDDALVVGGIVDIEPRTAFGADLRYVRSLGKLVAVSAGGIGYLVPATLLGACAGLEVRVPVAKKTFITAGPDLTVFALGSDLPERSVIWQALFQVGFRADF